MINSRSVVVFAILLCVVMIVGCGEKPAGEVASATVSGQMTPKETMKKLMVSLTDADADGFLACFDATEKEKVILAVMMDFVVAKSSLEDACRRIFGAAYATMNLGGPAAVPLTDAELDEFKFEIVGTTAVALNKDRKNRLAFVLKDGAWKLSADPFAPDATQAEKDIAILKSRTEIYREVAGKVIKPGATSEGIEKLLQDKLDELRMKEAEAVK